VCNFGWKASDCSMKVVPACEVNPGEECRIRTRWGGWVRVSELLAPLACECYKQFEEEMGFSVHGSEQVCFVRVGSGEAYDPALQTSVFPTEAEAEPVGGGGGSASASGGVLRARFLKYGEFKFGKHEASVDFAVAQKIGRDFPPTGAHVVPARECPESCNNNGRCIKDHERVKMCHC